LSTVMDIRLLLFAFSFIYFSLLSVFGLPVSQQKPKTDDRNDITKEEKKIESEIDDLVSLSLPAINLMTIVFFRA
jgi:hypothetical protein